MNLKRTDVEEQLQIVRRQGLEPGGLDSLLKELRISTETLPERPVNSWDFDRLETDRIYHERHIRQICITYRLRFLDLRYFKPELPAGAQSALRELEQAHGTRIDGLKVMAPSRLFKLEDKDDPLLLAPMGNGYFYLVHKWGNDLHPFRKWMAWPFKGIGNLTLLVLALSYLLTLLIPEGLFSREATSAQFWILFFFTFKSLAAIVIFYGFALGKNFNPAIWNSKYYNA